jgi:hypothetical protein
MRSVAGKLRFIPDVLDLGSGWCGAKPEIIQALRHAGVPGAYAMLATKACCENLGAPVLVALKHGGGALFRPGSAPRRVFEGPLMATVARLSQQDFDPMSIIDQLSQPPAILGAMFDLVPDRPCLKAPAPAVS